MKRFLLGSLLGLFVLIAVLTLRTLIAAGTFKKLEAHCDYQVSQIGGMPGAEDIVIDRRRQLAFISSCDRRAAQKGQKHVGTIFLLNLTAPHLRPHDLTAGWNQPDFRPHGISMFFDPIDSSTWIQVINHGDRGHSVEVFRFTGAELEHFRTITGDFLKSPNDLAATGREQFYFTNDHGASGSVSQWKDFLLIGTGEVGYFDGKNAHLLVSGLRYANGIAIGPDAKTLFVACTTDRTIGVYQIQPWQFRYSIPVGTGVDNLDFDENHDLWTAAHPKMLAFLRHAKDPANRSPSQVLKISADEQGRYTLLDEKCLDDGTSLSGSSVAASFQGMVYLGSVFDDGILVLRQP